MASAGSSYGSTQQPTYRVTAQVPNQGIPPIQESQNEPQTSFSHKEGNDESLQPWATAQANLSGGESLTEALNEKENGLHETGERTEEMIESVEVSDKSMVDNESRDDPPLQVPVYDHYKPMGERHYPLSSSSRPSTPTSRSIPASVNLLVPPQPLAWTTVPTSTPPSRSSGREQTPTDDAFLDELNSSISAQDEETMNLDQGDGPIVPSPPESPPPTRQLRGTPKPITPNRSNPNLRLSVTSASFTPSKLNVKTSAKKTPQPISTFSPSKVPSAKQSTNNRVRSSVSPSPRFSEDRSSIKRTTSTRSHQSAVDKHPDSFEDDYRPRPRQLIEKMLSKPSETRNRAKSSPFSGQQNPERQELAKPDDAMEIDEALHPAEQIESTSELERNSQGEESQASRTGELPEYRPGQRDSALPDETNLFSQPGDSSYLANGDPVRDPGNITAHSRRFQDLDSSAPQPSPDSALNFTASTQNYGLHESSSQSFHFTATQIASQRMEATQTDDPSAPVDSISLPLFETKSDVSMANPPHPLVPAHRQLSRSKSRAGSSVHQATNGLVESSSTSNGTGNSRVGPSRLLQRVNPRREEPQHTKQLGMTRPIGLRSAPMNTLTRNPAATRINSTIAAPERVQQDMEPTQLNESVNRSSSQPSMPAEQNLDMHDTLVDEAPPSPPHGEASSPPPRPPHGNFPSSPPSSQSQRPRLATIPSPSQIPPSSPPPTPLSADGTTSQLKDVRLSDNTSASNALSDGTGLQPSFANKTLPEAPDPKLVSPRKYTSKRRNPRLNPQPADIALQSRDDLSDDPAALQPKAKRAKIASISKSKGVPGKQQSSNGLVSHVERINGDSSDDSGTTVEDPEDNTWRPPAQPLRPNSRKVKVKDEKLRPVRNTTRPLSTTTSSRDSPFSKNPAGPSYKRSNVQDKPDSRSLRQNSATVSAQSVESSALVPPFRVLGLWSSSAKYYVGTVTEITQDTEKPYHVEFDDGYRERIAVEHLRLLKIQKGDKVRSQNKLPTNTTMIVSEDLEDGDEKVRVECKATDPFIPLAQLYITTQSIKNHFDDRRLDDIPEINALHRKGLKGTVFLVTSNSTNSAVVQNELSRKIEKYGGTIATDWEDLFDRSNDGFSSTLVTADTPFLVIEGTEVMKPKMVAMLAAGVPCLSSEYIDDAITRSADWREYLVSPGKAIGRQFHSSQTVDLEWGEDGWDPRTAQRLRRPFDGKSFLFLRPRASGSFYPSVKALVPFCLHALGASSLKQVDKADGVDIQTYDILNVEDRDTSQAIPNGWKLSRKLANFIWLKQCIIVGGALPPALMMESGKGK